MAFPDPNQAPATLGHLPAIYQVAATEAVEADGPLLVFLRAYEAAISSINVTIDAGATYFDPLTAPALSADRPGIPQPPVRECTTVGFRTAVALLQTLLTRAKAILAAEGYPDNKRKELGALVERLAGLVERSESLVQEILEVTEKKPNLVEELEELIDGAWAVIDSVATNCDPLTATAVSMFRRPGAARPPAPAALRAILERAKALLQSPEHPADKKNKLGPLIESGEPLLVRLAEIEELFNESWSLAQELQTYLGRPEVAAQPDFLTWLGTCVGLDLAEVETASGRVSLETKRRHLVKEAAVLWQHRGTPQGLKATLAALYDMQVDIEEWAWPQGMRIEQSSTIGVDTVLLPPVDLQRSFVAVWKTPKQFETLMRRGEWRLTLHGKHEQSSRRQLRAMIITESDLVGSEALRRKAHKLRRAIDRERPAHTNCYLALSWEQPAAFAAQPMQIEVHSTIGVCFLS